MELTKEDYMHDYLKVQRSIHLSKELASQLNLISKFKVKNYSSCKILYNSLLSPFLLTDNEINDIIKTAKLILKEEYDLEILSENPLEIE